MKIPNWIHRLLLSICFSIFNWFIINLFAEIELWLYIIIELFIVISFKLYIFTCSYFRINDQINIRKNG